MLKNQLLATMGGAPANYIEDVFSTYLYTGNGSTQTINNGIDLAGKGGMAVVMNRGGGVNWIWADTARGVNKYISSNSTAAEGSSSSYINAFNSNGFTGGANVNSSGANYASWTFRKQPKFFDVVTYTGDGTSGRVLSHSLGSAPGCVIIKCTSAASHWFVYHTSLGFGTNMGLLLNSTVATGAGYDPPLSASSSTNITLSTTNPASVNGSGNTYVAYLFAHNAGGFGLTGTDNVISCGSFTTDASGNATVNLGYEPQWMLVKRISNTGNWQIMDNMRGWPATASSASALFPNLSIAEISGINYPFLNATGFSGGAGALEASSTFIYIAIRRGPMKVPTDATKVYNAQKISSTTSPQLVTTGFVTDLGIRQDTTGGAGSSVWADRLRGATQVLRSTGTGAEFNSGSSTAAFNNDIMTGWSDAWSGAGLSLVYWGLHRAPGFFDEVCYTGTGAATTITHNLGVAPELMIVKSRSNGTTGYDWAVYSSGLTSAAYYLLLNTNAAQNSGTAQWNSTAPTASVFSVGTGSRTNGSGATFVAYLFATCPGVSKVGSYTGTGTTQQINCGFTAGARFVLIKRTDSTGDWYVWDSARGIVTGNDPYLLLNSTAAEVTTTDYIDPYSAGFEISSTAPAAINASGGSFIYLAIA